MKHLSGSGVISSAKTPRPAASETILRDSRSKPVGSRRAARITKTAATPSLVTDIPDTTAVPGHRHVVRPIKQQQYLDPGRGPAVATANAPNVPHKAAQMQKPRRSVITRVASHGIDVSSELSSSDSEPEGGRQASLYQLPAAAAAAAAADDSQASVPHTLRRRTQHADTTATGTAAAAAAAAAGGNARSRQARKTLRKPTPSPPRAAAAAAEGRGPSPPPGSRQQQRQPRTWRQTAQPALSVLACLLLLVATGSAVRAVASWRSGLNLKPRLAQGSDWALNPNLASPTAAVAAAAKGGEWQHPGDLQGTFHSTAQRALSHVSMWAQHMGAWARQAASSSAAAAAPAAAAPAGPHAAVSSSSSSSSRGLRGSSVSTQAASTSTPSTAPLSSSSSSSSAAGSIKLYAVVDAAAASPFRSHSPQGSQGLDWSANWGQVLQHMAQRLDWTDPRFSLQVVTQDELRTDPQARQNLEAGLSTLNPPTSPSASPTAPIFVGIGITDPEVVTFLTKATAQLPTAVYYNSHPSLSSSSRVDGFSPGTSGPVAKFLAQSVKFTREAKAAEVMKTLDILWGRDTSDDLLYIWLVLLNQYVTPVPMVANTTKGTDLASLYCMISKCGQKIVDCVSDKTCKAGLDCLEGCAFNDQVCQYRCIVSYETPQFEQFALCILQLNNCRGLNAEIPMRPDPAPMPQWRGQALSHEAAEDLFIGWLSAGPQIPAGGEGLMKPYSWLVAAGKNPAYDAFGCQHQLYYRGKGKGQLWYEPVFRVTTLEGQEVWRKRRYRVRRGKTPGTFHYSVLDNGVTSNEYWRIIDCAEDLTYCLFYYSGAAAAAGMSYSGAVLGTRDGLWPGQYTERIHGALRQAGIEPWELSMPDNSRCTDAPLTAAVA